MTAELILILAIDVRYENGHAVAAGVEFENWTDSDIRQSYLSHIREVGDYIPGHFYKRELPCILALLSEHDLSPDTIVIDGYVYLDGHSRPGLGWHLYNALKQTTPIIGVAKKPYKGITADYAVFRGQSEKPLYVTCAGVTLCVAKKLVASMHGKYRLPTILRIVDQLSKTSRWNSFS